MMRSMPVVLMGSLVLGEVAMAQPLAPAPPPGPYLETCSDIQVRRDQILITLTAKCQGSRRASSIPLPCVGEIINRDGELVCRPRGHSSNPPAPMNGPKTKR